MIDKSIWGSKFADSDITHNYFKLCSVDTSELNFEKHHILPRSVFPEETKLKLSKALSGENNPRFGISLSDELKSKISKSLTGNTKSAETNLKRSNTHKTLIKSEEHVEKLLIAARRPKSEETKRKMSEVGKGKIKTEEHRKRLSEAKKGCIISEETRTKISISNTGKVRSEETKAKISKIHKGKQVSDETKLKMSISRKLYFANKKKLELEDKA